MFLERETRPHKDIEIVVFRPDQIALQNYLGGWTLKQASDGKLTNWKRGEILELPIHAVHCFNEAVEPRFLEVLLNEINSGEWLYRRNLQVKMPLSKFHLTSESRTKFLCPEIVLLYKSKNPWLEDQQDFKSAAPRLGAESRSWLKNALTVCYGEHSWTTSL